MLDIDTALAWRGCTVRDRDGEKVGTFGDLYLDGDTDRPAYAGVKTGLFRSKESIVPLDGAYEADDGDVPPASREAASFTTHAVKTCIDARIFGMNPFSRSRLSCISTARACSACSLYPCGT